jgi:hypothetical protein
MPKPTWSKTLSFALDIERGMPKRIIDTWKDSVEFLDRLVRERSLDLYHVFIHWHPDPDAAHYCGVTYIDEKRMAFCSGNDRGTMLHEVAHLQYKAQPHDEVWAEHLINLHNEYLEGSELEKANLELVRDYRAAGRVLKRMTTDGPKEKLGRKKKVKKS